MPWRRAESEAEMLALGREFAAGLSPGAMVILTGDLVAGKTTFSKGVIEGLTGTGPSEVTSPTYTLVHEYRGLGRRVYHLDLYRLETEAEVWGIGLDDLLDGESVLLVEWGEKFRGVFGAAIQVEMRVSGEGREVRWA